MSLRSQPRKQDDGQLRLLQEYGSFLTAARKEGRRSIERASKAAEAAILTRDTMREDATAFGRAVDGAQALHGFMERGMDLGDKLGATPPGTLSEREREIQQRVERELPGKIREGLHGAIYAHVNPFLDGCTSKMKEGRQAGEEGISLTEARMARAREQKGEIADSIRAAEALVLDVNRPQGGRA